MVFVSTQTDEESRGLEEQLLAARRAAAEAHTICETLLASAPVGIGFVDRDLRVLQVNDTLAAVAGVAASSQLGRHLADVVPHFWPQIGPLYQRVLDTGEPVVNVEVSGHTASDPDRTRHWLASYYPVRLGAEVIGAGVVVVDITERYEADAARAALTRAVVDAIAATVEARDPYTAGHQRRVASISVGIAREMGLDEETVEGIALAANIHDVGKIGVPAEILVRPNSLRPAEWEIVKMHPRIGSDIVTGITFPWPVAAMILQHHERLDGSGYPDGCRGDQIVLGARVIAVADTVEAMGAHRPYRPALGERAALAAIASGRGTLFDADAVDACTQLVQEGRLPPTTA
jgi:PAS domain S-box-containing protein